MTESTRAPPHPAPQIENPAAPHDPQPTSIFAAAVSTTRMPMVVTDPNRPDNPVVFCNDAFTAATGYAEADVLGRNCRFLQGPDTDPAAVARIREAVSARREIAIELLNYRKDGSTFWNALLVAPVFGVDGRLLYFFASQLDVTQQRETEEALHEARRMDAVGQLTGGIAHHFNNLLQVITGYTDILDARLGPGDRIARRAVDAIGNAATQGASLTQHLLAFARKQDLRDSVLNFNALIEDATADIEGEVGGGLTVQCQLDVDLWPCRVDAAQARIALHNILANVRDATHGRGVVTIETRNITLPDGHAVAARRLDPGEYVLVRVRDDGPGIDPTVIEKVFDPFFTTKDRGRGAGLGLAMVYGFVRQSGGLALAANAPSGGAEISLFFPRARGAAKRPARAAARRAGRREPARVLMVEDQAEVGELGEAMLRELGYTVERVASAHEALDLLARDCDFDLLFTDILMPGGMTGVALADTVARDYPRIAILLTTGYSDEAMDAGAHSYALIRKPYRRADLNERIRALLGRRDKRSGLSQP